MAASLKSLLRKTLARGGGNLQSLEDPYVVLAGLLEPGRVTGILDAGASDGRVSRRLLARYPAAHVYAFEPQAVYRAALETLDREEPRFHPEFRALADHAHEAHLNVTRSPGATSLFAPSTLLREAEPEASVVESVERVEAVTLDGWASAEGVAEFQLMKLDIQGGELAARGGWDGLLRGGRNDGGGEGSLRRGLERAAPGFLLLDGRVPPVLQERERCQAGDAYSDEDLHGCVVSWVRGPGRAQVSVGSP